MQCMMTAMALPSRQVERVLFKQILQVLKWSWRLSERNYIFQEAFAAVQYWHFKTSLVLQFSEWGNLTECSNFSWWSLVIAIMKENPNEQTKTPHFHRISAHWPSELEIPAQTQTLLHKFCTSWYQFLTMNTKVKGTWEKYLLPSALSGSMLALVSMCRKALIKTGFHPVPPTLSSYTLFSTLVIFSKCNYLYFWFIRQP